MIFCDMRVFTFVSIFHCPLLALLHKGQTYIYIYIYTYMWPWTTKAVLSRTGIFIANNILHGSKLYFFLLCEKSSGHYVEIMFHEDTFPTVNISKLNFWYVLCIAKNLIWTTLKMIFSIFRLFLTFRFSHCWDYDLILFTNTKLYTWLNVMPSD